MKRISSYVIIKAEHNDIINHKCFTAYFRGTNNRVRYSTGTIVPSRCSKYDLKYDLLHNDVEVGTVVNIA